MNIIIILIEHSPQMIKSYFILKSSVSNRLKSLKFFNFFQGLKEVCVVLEGTCFSHLVQTHGEG